MGMLHEMRRVAGSANVTVTRVPDKNADEEQQASEEKRQIGVRVCEVAEYAESDKQRGDAA